MGRRPFKAPTLQEVIEYCAERGNDVDPEKFYDFYSVSEWTDSNGKPVRNWKQKVITWEGRKPRSTGNIFLEILDGTR